MVAPRIINPPRNAGSVPLNPMFSWSVPAVLNGSDVSFDLLVDTSYPPTDVIASSLREAHYTLTESLKPGNIYYWQVVAKTDGIKKTSEIYPLTTGDVFKPVTSIETDRSTVIMVEGERTYIKARVNPFDASNKNIIWHTSDPNIVGVSSLGLIVGIGEGIAAVTASSEDRSVSTQVHITVESNAIIVHNIILDKTEINLKAPGREKLRTVIVPSNASDKSLVWSTLDEDIAIVDDGNIVAKGNGTTTIVVTNPASGVSARCEVNVIGNVVEVTSVVLNKHSVFLTIDSSETLTATVLPNNASNKNVTWKSNDSGIATVDNIGVVRGIQEGSTFVTATAESGDFLATATVNVVTSLVSVSGIDIRRRAVTLKKDELTPLIADVFPSDASDKTIMWNTNNPGIARVNDRGTVTAISRGTAIITATTQDGNYADTCDINVIIPTTDVTITPSSPPDMEIGNTTILNVTLTPDEANGQNIVWYSDDDTIATVDDQGHVTGISSGIAKITASAVDSDVSGSVVVTVTGKYHRFTHGDHTYYIVLDVKTWQEAVSIAKLKNGYLVHIDSEEEQREIQNQIAGSKFKFTQHTTEPDNKRYIWIGATDKADSTTWIWDGDNDGTGDKFGEGYAPTNGWTPTGTAYHNWGNNSSTSQQYQPDNGAYAGIADRQHYGAIALEDWEYGQQYQWDDINGSNRLPYIIEVDNIN